MKIHFTEIEDAFFFVSSAPKYTNQATLCKKSAKIYYSSEYSDGGEDETPDDIYEHEDCIPIPHKNELDLGRNLVFEFVDEHLPADFERVRAMFKRRGAYGRYKGLLEDRGQLQEWYDFENERQTEALREWCEENNITLSADA